MSKKCHLDGLKLDFFFLKVHLTSISNLFEVSTFDVEEATITVTRSGWYIPRDSRHQYVNGDDSKDC